MKKISFPLLVLATIACLPACKSDPSGPSEPVIMASYYDGALVDVSGTWRLITDPPGNITMTISSPSLRWFAQSQLPYKGTVDKTYNRTVVTKRNGLEREATIYGLRIDDQQWGLGVRSQDSISIGPCLSDPERAAIEGYYVRVK